jgi:hypothetical protein
MSDLRKLLNIRAEYAEAYEGSTNAHVERFHRYLKAALTMIGDKHKRDWDEQLWAVLLAYRTTTNTTTGVSPFFAMYGRHPRLPLDTALGLSFRQAESSEAFVQESRRLLREVYDEMREKQREAAERNQRYTKRGRQEVTYEEGQWILVWDPKGAEPLPMAGRRERGSLYRDEDKDNGART